jgi:asparagine synthase (glutamine-hydrolysing)
MMDLIRHRGPDDEGSYFDDRVALGHTRLSIIDLQSGSQPIFNEDHSVCIVFNGEIYNYLELRLNLIGCGHVFTTKSDTEVILHLYEEKGFRCTEDLRGMFAFAIWDKNKKQLFLARDHIGIKPVYYHCGPKAFSFASEIKALVYSGLVEREINLPLLNQYITLNYTIGPETMVKNVMKLMPGHFLVVEKDRVTTSQYWDFAGIPETSSNIEKCQKKLKDLLEESVRIEMRSDVPIGAFLSGGIDSSLIVAYMTRISGKPVKTFTVGYEEADDVSELKYARIVAKYFGTDHHEFILKPKKFVNILSRMVWHMDEPVAEFATIPLLLLSELAKNHVTVMLSGEGADELFAGYPIYRYMNYIEKYQKISPTLRKYVFDPIGRIFLAGRRDGKYSDWLSTPLERRYLGNGSYFTEKMKQRLFTEDFQRNLDYEELSHIIEGHYQAVRSRNPIQRMLYLDTKTWLPEDLLIKADKMTMAAAIELRVPFIDFRLLEFATSLPAAMKVHRGTSKYILKKIAEDLLPHQIVHRPKMGFPVPVKQWLQKELNILAREILTERRTIERGIFNPHYVERILALHSSGKDDFSKQIWNLMILEIWLRVFLEGGKINA